MNSLPSQTALDIHVFVNDHSIPCSIIALNSPAPGVVAYEPRALRFLERVAGFHTVCVISALFVRRTCLTGVKGNLPEMYLGRFIPVRTWLFVFTANDNSSCITL